MDKKSIISALRKNFDSKPVYRQGIIELLTGQDSSLTPFLNELPSFSRDKGLSVNNIDEILSILAVVPLASVTTSGSSPIEIGSLVTPRAIDHDAYSHVVKMRKGDSPLVKCLVKPDRLRELLFGGNLRFFSAVALEYHTVRNDRWALEYRACSVGHIATLLSEYDRILQDEGLYGRRIGTKEVSFG